MFRFGKGNGKGKGGKGGKGKGKGKGVSNGGQMDNGKGRTGGKGEGKGGKGGKGMGTFGKGGKGGDSDRPSQPKEKVNPFEERNNKKTKYEVLNRRIKGGTRNVAKARLVVCNSII